jgi:hypothetical protein
MRIFSHTDRPSPADALLALREGTGHVNFDHTLVPVPGGRDGAADGILDCEGPGSTYVYVSRACKMVAAGWDPKQVAEALHGVLFPAHEEE